MRVNVTRPLQIFQHTVYISIVGLVELFVIFPLACLLFHDFYKRLVPLDSAQIVPMGAFDSCFQQYSTKTITSTGSSSLVLEQKIKRLSIDGNLPLVSDNGLSEPITLRQYSNYKLDIDINFFCMTGNHEVGPIASVELLILSMNSYKKYEVVYKRLVPILCMINSSSITVPNSGLLKTSRLRQFETEWLNKIDLQDVIPILPNYKGIKITLGYARDTSLIFTPQSKVTFRLDFKQGLRNLMARRRLLSYLVGIPLFFQLLTVFVVLTALVSFVTISRNFNTGRANENVEKKNF